MANFKAEEYKKALESSADINSCEKVPIPNLQNNQSYIFISYSHRDYKKVYSDLADLYESGIPFWYDRGLPAGKNWDDVVREKLNDPKCGGVIFYLSENLFLSQSIQTEIHIVCDSEQDTQLDKLAYFAVNLTGHLPSKLLANAFSLKIFADSDDRMTSFISWSQTLAKAFPDKATYLPFSSPAHKADLLEQINACFNISTNRNIYDFSTAKFISGVVIMEFETGSRYEGEFTNGVFNGVGIMYYSNGNTYSGNWLEGKANGMGVFIQSDGTRYDGEWLNNRKHGRGKNFYSDGKLAYDGEWKYDKRHGKGILHYPPNGDLVYDGEWKDNKQNGYGVAAYRGNIIYDGFWKNGQKHGCGTFYYPNGDVYIGDWENGKRHGKGKMTLADGTVYLGTFENDEFIGE